MPNDSYGFLTKEDIDHANTLPFGKGKAYLDEIIRDAKERQKRDAEKARLMQILAPKDPWEHKKRGY